MKLLRFHSEFEWIPLRITPTVKIVLKAFFLPGLSDK